MDNPGGELQPRTRKDFFLLISNLILVLCIVGSLWMAFSNYQGQIATISLSESRYLSTEWRLLQELKIQTDQKLLEKDQEIADLNKRYLRLVQGDASALELHQIKTRLQQARDERTEILLLRVPKTANIDPGQQAWLKELLPSENQSTIARLLQKRIETLEVQLEEHTLYGQELEKELTGLRVRQREAALEYERTIAENIAQIDSLSTSGARLRTALETALEQMKRKARDSESREPPLFEDLATRALVRALAGSQAIRAEYPTLLGSLDRYFVTYGLQERMQGRREAYAAATEALEVIVRETGLPRDPRTTGP